MRAGRGGNTREYVMLSIYGDMLVVIRGLRGCVADIGRRDRDLEDQIRRAASSVALNIAEGSGSFGKMRTVRYRTALGSARETLACLRVAEAFGYVDSMPTGVVRRMDRIVGTLVKVAQ